MTKSILDEMDGRSSRGSQGRTKLPAIVFGAFAFVGLCGFGLWSVSASEAETPTGTDLSSIEMRARAIAENAPFLKERLDGVVASSRFNDARPGEPMRDVGKDLASAERIAMFVSDRTGLDAWRDAFAKSLSDPRSALEIEKMFDIARNPATDFAVLENTLQAIGRMEQISRNEFVLVPNHSLVDGFNQDTSETTMLPVVARTNGEVLTMLAGVVGGSYQPIQGVSVEVPRDVFEAHMSGRKASFGDVVGTKKAGSLVVEWSIPVLARASALVQKGEGPRMVHDVVFMGKGSWLPKGAVVDPGLAVRLAEADAADARSSDAMRASAAATVPAKDVLPEKPVIQMSRAYGSAAR